MARWFIARGTKQHGPVDDQKLRQLALSGKLKPDDIVRREDEPAGRPAKDIEGLLPLSIDDLPSTEEAVKAPTAAAVGENLKAGASVLGTSAKTTAQLAAKQADKTRLTNISLPLAFTELGQQVFETLPVTTDWQPLYDDIKRVLSEMDLLSRSTSSQPPATSFVEKAQRVAANTGAAATKQLLQQKLRQHYSTLGRRVYEGSSAGADDKRGVIAALLSQVQSLDTDIASLTSTLSAQKAEAGKVASSFLQAGKSLLFSPWVVKPTAVLFAPVGIPLVWFHPTWRKRQKALWIGISALCFALFCIWAIGETNRVGQAVKQAHALWERSEKAAALETYRQLLKGSGAFIADAERSIVFQRVIEAECESGNTDAAKKLIKKAKGLNVQLSLSTPVAQRVLAQVAAEEEQKKRAAEIAQQNKAIARQQSETQATTARDTSEKTFAVSRGMFGGKLTVEVDPDVAQYMTFRDMKWDSSLRRVTFKMTMEERSLADKYANPMRERDPWITSVYDSEGIKLATEPLLFGGSIRTGQTVKAQTFSIPKEAVRIRIDHR
jgi:hypothetical protein